MGNFRSGGLIYFNFYNDNVIVDRYGFLPIQAFGELKNETWRFAGGLQMDIFAPLLPTVLPFSYLVASGNPGLYRGQLRAERYFYPSDIDQITFTAGISEPISTTVVDSALVPGVGGDHRGQWLAGPGNAPGLGGGRARASRPGSPASV